MTNFTNFIKNYNARGIIWTSIFLYNILSKLFRRHKSIQKFSISTLNLVSIFTIVYSREREGGREGGRGLVRVWVVLLWHFLAFSFSLTTTLSSFIANYIHINFCDWLRARDRGWVTLSGLVVGQPSKCFPQTALPDRQSDHDQAIEEDTLFRLFQSGHFVHFF